MLSRYVQCYVGGSFSPLYTQQSPDCFTNLADCVHIGLMLSHTCMNVFSFFKYNILFDCNSIVIISLPVLGC